MEGFDFSALQRREPVVRPIYRSIVISDCLQGKETYVEVARGTSAGEVATRMSWILDLEDARQGLRRLRFSRQFPFNPSCLKAYLFDGREVFDVAHTSTTEESRQKKGADGSRLNKAWWVVYSEGFPTLAEALFQKEHGFDNFVCSHFYGLRPLLQMLLRAGSTDDVSVAQVLGLVLLARARACP